MSVEVSEINICHLLVWYFKCAQTGYGFKRKRLRDWKMRVNKVCSQIIIMNGF